MRLLLPAVLLVPCLFWLSGCDGGSDPGEDATTSSTVEGGSEHGDVVGLVGETIKVGSATITVRALQATFQPAMPAQRLSEQTPSAPASGESFYQAYVRVENSAVTPLRVDPADFVCVVGDRVVRVEPTRSGPFPRSLLKNTSLDLLLTFKGGAGFEPFLLYDPPWYDGTIRVDPQVEDVTASG